jgi:hypothetical protein
MATKLHTTKFVEYRRAARTDRPIRLTSSNDSDDPLMLSVDNGVEMTNMEEGKAQKRLENAVAPDWMRKIKPIEHSLESIKLESINMDFMD